MKSLKLQRWLALLWMFCLLLPQSTGYASRQPAPAQPLAPLASLAVLGGRVPSSANPPQDADAPDQRSEWYYAWREAGSPAANFTLAEAANLRASAAQQMLSQQQSAVRPQALNQFSGTWSPLGPNPIVQAGSGNQYRAVAGRVSALAVRSSAPHTIYLGAAQGGVWESSDLNPGVWMPMTDSLGSLAIGAIALAPSNEDIIYVGTGEGNLSSDSYYGNGILKSTNAGATFAPIGGSSFNQVSISRIVVDPGNANHVYAAVLAGKSGSPNVSPVSPTPLGIYESTDGGSTWIGRITTTNRLNGATDLVIDPQTPASLYATFWGAGIYKSTDSGLTWNSLMSNPGFPVNASYPMGLSRFSLGISRPSAAAPATLYSGFDWYDTGGIYHPSSIWKSSDGGATWAQTSTAVVGDYCGSQCWYDNAIGVDPTNPNIVFALGLFNYGSQSGGVFRSMNGGTSWTDLGWLQHPDFHAIAIRRDDPKNVVIGSDGGVWTSSNYGGRTAPGAALAANDWVNRNGSVNPLTKAISAQSNLQITQFNSVRQNPTIPGRIYGGAQDNGTSRRADSLSSWSDVASGDGGQALVDPYNARYVYGTYYDLSPYRFSDAGLNFSTNIALNNGLVTGDRSGFYVPFEMDPWQTQRLYIGSYRLYRSDNRGDLWTPISADLTSGCLSRATSPTGFGCVITAIGATAGGPYVYVGTGDGKVWLTSNAYDAQPAWVELTKTPLPTRPISRIAVDSSNYKVAYLSYGGFNAATSGQPGHVFRTADGGQTWTNISGDLTDIPVSTITLDPQSPSTLYIGTDVGPMVSSNTGSTWQPLGSGFPIVGISEISINPYTGLLRAASYGRGTWELPAAAAAPALQIRKQALDVPVGPGAPLTYTITVRNTGSAAATNVSVSDTLPAHTTFVSAANGGSQVANGVVWSGLTVPAATPSSDGFGSLVPGVITLSFVVSVDNNQTSGGIITNSQLGLTANNGIALTASPVNTTLSPASVVSLLPASQTDGGHFGELVSYNLTIQNLGYLTDHYSLSVSGNLWPTTFWDSNFTHTITVTPDIVAGASYILGVKVAVPAQLTNPPKDSATIKITSQAVPANSKTAALTTLIAKGDILLVDNDAIGSGNPDMQPIYRAALDAGNYVYDVWDLAQNANLPQHYLNAHKVLVWFTGASFPAPLLPYETQLAAFLDGGGRLFLSGQDLLDGSAGMTSFVNNYLHVTWDGSETQNDKPITPSLSGVPGNPLTAGLGPYTLNFASIGLADFSDLITPNGSAAAALQDSVGTRALTVTQGSHKIWFLAFPWEAISSPAARLTLLQRALDDLFVAPNYLVFLPNLTRQP